MTLKMCNQGKLKEQRRFLSSFLLLCLCAVTRLPALSLQTLQSWKWDKQPFDINSTGP